MEIPNPDPPPADGVVTLRPWRAEEAEVLAAAWADPAIQRWCSVPDDPSEERARRWLEGWEGRRSTGVALDLAVVTDEGVVGECGLGPIQWERSRAALGFWICSTHRRSGLAVRAVRLMTEWVHATLPVQQLVATAAVDNPASGWTLSAAGYHLEVERDGQQAWILRSP